MHVCLITRGGNYKYPIWMHSQTLLSSLTLPYGWACPENNTVIRPLGTCRLDGGSEKDLHPPGHQSSPTISPPACHCSPDYMGLGGCNMWEPACFANLGIIFQALSKSIVSHPQLQKHGKSYESVFSGEREKQICWPALKISAVLYVE